MNRIRKNLIFLLIGVMMMTSFSGCEKKQSYKVICPRGFENVKESYEPGEQVRVNMRFFATDTNYYFYSNDVVLKEDYDPQEGEIFSFTMPEHDVLISMYSENSMVYDPSSYVPRNEEYFIAQIEKCELVFDYYEATVGTDGGDGYDEFAVYREKDGRLFMAKYSQWNGGEKSCRACEITDTVFNNCMEAVDRHNMRKWKDGIAITGELYVVKFREAERTIRVSSDDMPENGLEAFGEIQEALSKGWKFFGPKD